MAELRSTKASKMKGNSLILLLLITTVTVHAQLSLLGINPAPDAANVSLSSDIVITFDQNIDASTLGITTVIVRGSQTGILSGVYTGGGTSAITFNPDNDFRLGEIISVTVTTALMSESPPSSLLRGYTHSFTVVSGLPPVNPLTLTKRTVGFASGFEDIKALDFDGDGDLDLLTGSEGFIERARWWENDGNQNFCQQTIGNYRNVEVYDIDGDGDFDSFGETGGFSKKINWFENDGTNSNFTEKLINGTTPQALTGGDIDSDGDIDLVAAIIIPFRIVWFSNDGNGNFSSLISIPTTFGGGSDSFLQVVDINADGAMDILAYFEDDRNMVWFENDGNQNFTERLIITTIDRQRLTTADVDGDGDIDIISTSTQNPAALSWFKNDGAENFTEQPITVTAINSMKAVQVSDLDGDMDMDILAGPYWFENDGAESFSEHLISPGLKSGTSTFATAIGYADLDGDGDMDLLSTGDDRISWQENNQFMNITGTTPANAACCEIKNGNISITFDQSIDNATVNGTNIRVVSQYSGVVAGILSGGGTNTITFNPDSDFLPGEKVEVSITDKVRSLSGHNLANNYGFTFTIQTTLVSQPDFTFNSVNIHASNVSGLAISDIDGDGDLDLASTSFTEVFWYENDGVGNFTTIPITTTATPTGIFTIDYDNDGDVDLLVDDNSRGVQLMINDGNQNFTETLVLGQGPLQQVLDADSDGDTDLLYTTRVDNWVTLIEFDCGAHLDGPNLPRIKSRSVQGADLDNDGDIDLIASSLTGSTFYENDGFKNYTTQSIDVIFTVDQDLADLDGDGDLDVVLVESFASIVWYSNQLNELSEDFSARQEIAVLNQYPTSVVTSDIDGDGDLDVAAVSKNDSKVVWYENRLNEISADFGAAQPLTPLASPILIKSADMDGDGDMDLITISEGDDRLTWYRNGPAPPAIIITLQPSDVDICNGENTSFTVTADGDTGLTYQWQEDQGSGFIDISDDTRFSGTGTSQLSISNAENAMSGFKYRCVISGDNAPDVTSGFAEINILAPVVITTQPTDETASAGNNITFTTTATGDNIVYQWQKDDVDLSGETMSSLTLISVAISDQGSYKCIISNQCNSEESNTALLTIATALISITTHPQDVTVCEKDNLSFTIVASGDTGLTYQWQEDQGSGFADIVDNSTFSGSNMAILSISEANAGLSGYQYQCVVSSDNAESIPSSQATITVESVPTPTITLTNDILTGPSGADTYQWLKQNVEITGATAQSLPLIRPLRTGDFTLQISMGGCIKVSDPILVTALLDNWNLQKPEIFPIPFNDNLSISNLPIDQDVMVEMWDMAGNMLLQKHIPASAAQTVSLKAKSLSPGIYLFVILQGGNVYTQRVIKY